MKLTETIRAAFVRAAMNDVPLIDYTEKTRDVVAKDIAAQLPPAIRKLWADSAMRPWVAVANRSYGCANVTVPSLGGQYGSDPLKLSEEARKQVEEFERLNSQQKASRLSLSNNLKAVAKSVSTRKQLADALPEFAKYLPVDEASAMRTVPAIANVVSDFVKAGWPKGKKQPATA